MWNRNVETFLGCDKEYCEADFVLFGAPFDSTASYRPGARFGSRTIRAESYGIETYSPYQDRDLLDIRAFDAGDLELPFGNPEDALARIESHVESWLSDGKVPVMLGGEHLVTLGAATAAAKKFPDLAIVQFDAHADLREDYLGQKLSHATVMRRVWEIVGDGRIYQFGIRSGDKSEFCWAPGHVFLHKFDFSGLEAVLETLKDKPVYFTLDLDVLDPAVFPGTGTPEAGGIYFQELLNALRKVGRLRIVGCDMTELCPPCDPSGASAALACKLLRELLLALRM